MHFNSKLICNKQSPAPKIMYLYSPSIEWPLKTGLTGHLTFKVTVKLEHTTFGPKVCKKITDTASCWFSLNSQRTLVFAHFLFYILTHVALPVVLGKFVTAFSIKAGDSVANTLRRGYRRWLKTARVSRFKEYIWI